jgi:hypothetical protein
VTSAKQLDSIREQHCYPLDYSRNELPTESPNTCGFELLAASIIPPVLCCLQATIIPFGSRDQETETKG